MTRTEKDCTELHDTERRFTSILLIGSLGVSSALSLVIGIADGRFLGVAAGFLGATALGTWMIAQLRRRRVGVGAFLVIATLNFLLVVPELILRAVRFSHVAHIEFGHPRPHHFVDLEPDEELFWTLRKSDPSVNSMGFLGAEPQIPKPPQTWRILFLGDSCMQWADYPTMVDSLIETLELPGSTVECVTLAMAGYSSHQGRILSQSYAAKLAPDLTVVCYGWNDHWLAYGAPDAEKTIHPTAMRLYNRIRLLQFARSRLSNGEEEPTEQVRVPAEQYRQNIAAIRDNLTEIGSQVLFLTAPSTHTTWGVPDYLIDMRFTRAKQSALDLHAQYNEIVRQEAEAGSCPVLDLETHFQGKGVRRYFWSDGIHYSQLGKLTVARTLTAFLVEQMRGNFSQ